jgi:hypothetical protein
MKKLALLVAASIVAVAGCGAPPSDDGATDPSQTGEDAFTARASSHAIVLAHGFDGSLTNRWSAAPSRAATRARSTSSRTRWAGSTRAI